MEGLKTYLMEDLIEEIAMGPFGSNIKVDCFVDSGVPVLNGANLQGYKLREDSFNYVTPDKADSLNKANAYRGDIVITHRGTLGQIVYIPEDSKYERYVISQSQFRVRVDTRIALPEYVVFFFHTRIGQHRLLANASQVGVPAIARPSTTFKKVEIELPPLQEQKKIVKVLNSLSDKIELNNRINHNLEEQAQTLYKSWFIDFEPFKNSRFVNSELGMIPENLGIKRIGEIPHTIESGKRPKGGITEVINGVPSIGAESIKGLGFYDYSKTKFVSRDFANSMKKGIIRGYELLIYKDGGKPGYFIPNFSIFGEGFPFEEMTANEHVFILDFGDRGFNAFSYFFFQTEVIMNYLNAQGGKAAIPGINRNDIESICIFSPQNQLIRDFGERVTPMIQSILKRCKENHQLSLTRDSLLPRLLSGDLLLH